MANTKISALTSATTPVAGTEVLPIVQSSATKQVSIANLTAGRSVSGTSFVPTGSTIPANGLYLPAANAVGLSTNTTNAVYIDSSQNVGIGVTPSGTFRLQIEASSGLVSVASSTGTNASNIRTTNTGGSLICGIDNSVGTVTGTAYATYLNNTANTPLTFQTNSAERMRIDASGRFLVGTLSATIGGQSVALALDATTANTGYGLGINGNASNTQVARFAYAGTAVGSIVVSSSTTTYNVASDQRLKENIVDTPEFGSVIDAIQVRSFDWITDQTHQRAGFVAQELVTVAPEAVYQPADPKEMMAVDYSKLVPMLVKEIQSLRKRLANANIA